MPTKSSYMRVDVRCPFYKGDEHRRRIICEGIVDRSTISLSFGSSKDFSVQANTFCCNRYQNCEIYMMLMASKYDGV